MTPPYNAVDLSTKKLLRHPATILIVIFLLGWLGIQFWEVAQKAYVLYEERKKLELELASLQKRKAEFEEGLSRFQSDAYLEREAKRRLNLKKSGEQVIIIIPEEKNEPAATIPSFWKRIGATLLFWKQ